MKRILLLLIAFGANFSVGAQKTDSVRIKKPDPAKQLYVLEASCGQCQFGMKGNGCSLAVKIDGKCYFVDGTSIDEHGDAHAKDGFCEAIRKAEVQGEILNGRFKVTYFTLKPEAKKKE